MSRAARNEYADFYDKLGDAHVAYSGKIADIVEKKTIMLS